MNTAKSNGTFLGAGVFSAIAASLCCITPIIALLAGSSSIAASFSWIEPARPYLIAVSIAALALAWFIRLKPVKENTTDCNCEVPQKAGFLQSTTFLGIVTVFAVLMMSFPLYAKMFTPGTKAVSAAEAEDTKQVKFAIAGMTCAGCEAHVNSELSKLNGVVGYSTSYATKSSLVTYNPLTVDVKTIEEAINKTGYTVKQVQMIAITPTTSNISFFEAPLVCHAAPSIGCGSKAKFMLVDLEKNDMVEGAWLNRKGTIVAVEWKPNIDSEKKHQLVRLVSTSHGIELSETAASDYSKTFPNKNEWFKGVEVDRLSREEAATIARNTIQGYKKDGVVKPSFEKQFEADIERIYTELFLSISSCKDLTTDAYNEVENKIQKAGEKYVGKGKMPRVELCVAGESCEKDQSCSEDGKSCCEKN